MMTESVPVPALRLPRWGELPDLELYMDQLLSLVSRYLGQDGKTLTASMVNNYVKMGAVPPPRKKRYTRTHLVRLIMICVLKSVFPLSAIQALLMRGFSSHSEEAFYDSFCLQYEQAAREAAVRMQQAQDEDAEFPLLHAALQAQAEQQCVLLALDADEPTPHS